MATTHSNLTHYAATISGRFALDASANHERGTVEIKATASCLRDVRDELEADGVHAEVHTLDGEMPYGFTPALLEIRPLPDQLEAERESEPDFPADGWEETADELLEEMEDER